MKKLFCIIVLLLTFGSYVNAQSSNQQSSESSDAITSEVIAQDFSNCTVNYQASLDAFDKGVFGISVDGYFGKNFGFTTGTYYNFDSSNLFFEVGPIYGCPISKNVLFGTQLKGVIVAYDEVKLDANYKKKDSKTKIGGGLILMPHLDFKFGKLLFKVGYNLGWIKTIGKAEFGHNFQVGLGFCI